MKRALVVGSAADVWTEVDAALKLFTPDTIYCVKMAGVYWKGGRFIWVGLHPEHMKAFREEREKLGLHCEYETVGPPSKEVGQHGKHQVDRRVSYLWPGMNASAGSGIFGAKVALDDGHDRVVLCGIPMTPTRYFAPHRQWKDRPWGGLNSFAKGLTESVPHLKDRVRSMSGQTKELLGAPTPSWIAGEPQ